MYYVLDYDYPRDEEGRSYTIEDELDFEGVRSWTLGRPFTAKLPNPIHVQLIPEDGFQGNPPEMFHEYICLMSKPMVKAIRSAGADNLDVYPAVLVDNVNQRLFDYQAVNIIGMMAVVEIRKSRRPNPGDEPGADMYVNEAVIDPNKARGQLLFRLAETAKTIIIHERVKRALEAAEFKTLVFKKTNLKEA